MENENKNEKKNAYSEVIEILKTIDSEKRLEALPMEMLELLKSKANPEYKPEISTEIPLDEQNLQPETLSILSWIALKYWNDEINDVENCIIDNEKANVEEVLKEDQEKLDTEKVETTEESDCTSITLYKDYKWYQKIKIKIIEFFRRFFGRTKKQEIDISEKGIN